MRELALAFAHLSIPIQIAVVHNLTAEDLARCRYDRKRAKLHMLMPYRALPYPLLTKQVMFFDE